MKQAITLLIAGSAMGLASAAFAGSTTGGAHERAFKSPTGIEFQVLSVSGDDDDEEGWFWSRSREDEDEDDNNDDDDDDDACNDDDDDDHGGCAAGNAGNAAPAGTVAPPRNGLFTNGTAPQVTSN
jgi:hypothetical protein